MDKNIKTIHFIGIKGVGMAALAILAKEMGYEISGSDVMEKFVTEKSLLKTGIRFTEFDIENVRKKPDLIIYSAAYDKDNLEIKEARKKHLNLLPYSEALALLSEEKQVIAISGIHGKTTTTSLITYILTKANLDPSYIIGAGEVELLNSIGHFGKGDYFILEADEYRKSSENLNSKFYDLSPQIEVITSIEMDHPDIFSTEEDVYKAFYKFACKTPRSGFIVLCLDYPKARKLYRSLVDRNFETYGFREGSSWQIIDFYESLDESSFTILHNQKKLGPFKIKLPGIGNCLNATASIIVCLNLGLEEKTVKKYLSQFKGVKRRFEKIAEINNLVLIDDYAHHPRSVSMTLDALKVKYPRYKIWCIFQPHTYSRTKELLIDFGKSFKSADKVIVTDIFSSAREKIATISGEDLVSEIKKNNRSVIFMNDWSKIIKEIEDHLNVPTVVITMGAGNIYQLGNELIEKIKNDKKNKLS